MKGLFLHLIFIAIILPMHSQTNKLKTVFELNQNSTATYFETISYYETLEKTFEDIQVTAIGMTDSGHPLHEVIISKDGVFDPQKVSEANRLVLFINNAIHPGEPCGVDASMMLARDVLQNSIPALEDVVIVIIPFYNIGGGLNRGSFSRANQNGPFAYGFRGNAKNLDLNRDFIKCDSENAKSFTQIYSKWKPDVFIDNHTSNGADYQYVLTMISTQADKLEAPMKNYLNEKLEPSLYKGMIKKGWEMTPYVYARKTPDDGIAGFLDLPRYSSGYAALHFAYSFIPEAHMLKPYNERVQSIYAFMDLMITEMKDNKLEIRETRRKAIEAAKKKDLFHLNWDLDKENFELFSFKGFEAKYKASHISGKERLYYDRSAPYTKDIKYFKYFKGSSSVAKPAAYLIPKAYKQVVTLLEMNGVQIEQLDDDKFYDVEQYSIGKFETTPVPYEGHYLHFDIEVEKNSTRVKFYKGDYLVSTNQDAIRLIIETLEPQAPDSYFAWNYFDAVLQQKEYYSSYVFEDLAAEILEKNPALKAKLDNKKAKDETFANDGKAQLDFIYKNSPHYEPTVNLYPVVRLMKLD